jgi:hypothetical protein
MTKLVIAAIGLAVGILGTTLYQSLTGSADINYECSSNASRYTCRFFNRGPGSGALCVKVFLKRDRADTYLKPVTYDNVVGERVCSGPLEKGQDKVAEGNSFYTPEGKGVSAEDLCRTKATASEGLFGCALETRIVDWTR